MEGNNEMKYNSTCECGSTRIMDVCGKVSDMFGAGTQGKQYSGYVPAGLNIGEGDYLEFGYCLDCGRIQGKFPIDMKTIDKVFKKS
jgi:hypothetical protein